MSTFRCTVEGTAADGQTWRTEGVVSTDSPGEFVALFHEAMRGSFQELTRGRAVFGRPGAACRGPYRIRKFLLEELLT